MLLQQSHCSVVHSLILLLRGIGCLLLSRISLHARSAGGRICDAALPRWERKRERVKTLYVCCDWQATQNNAMSVSLVGGRLVVMHVTNGQTTALESNETYYSDGMWHYITVTKEGRQSVATHTHTQPHSHTQPHTHTHSRTPLITQSITDLYHELQVMIESSVLCCSD